MTALAPLETLVEDRRGLAVPLPPELSRVYGSLRVPRAGARPRVITNAVMTLDGVVSLNVRGHASGGTSADRTDTIGWSWVSCGRLPT